MKSMPLEERADANHAIVWENQRLYLLDQRVLPQQERYLELQNAVETASAIGDMVVRGAPAIGITAAYAVVLAARHRYEVSAQHWKNAIDQDLSVLAAARPTAVNLSWALQRMRKLLIDLPAGDPVPALLAEARDIHQQDVADNKLMGDLGAELIVDRTSVITHCNAGALATGGYGTALGVIRSASRAGRIERVYADETRPWLQGARLTAWELARDGIPVALQADGAAASRMAQGGVDWVVVGSDRIAANGDVANKIGTYNLAVAARFHGVKVMVVAPTSSVDMSTSMGSDIPIETRDSAELLSWNGGALSPPGVEAWNPVFDITPAALVDVIVTEKGVVHWPDAEKMAKLMS